MTTLSPAQFTELLGTLGRPGKRIEKFSSGLPADWVAWRSNFQTAVQLNNWNNTRARLEIHGSISGTAHVYVGHIPSGVIAGQAVADYANLLDEYEAFFLPASASNLARQEVKNASQDEGESILHWHGRLRSLYQRANPQLTAQQLHEDRNLIATFIDGLVDGETIRFTLQANPENYGAALTTANNSFSAAAGHRRALAIKTEPANNSIGAITKASKDRPCNTCGSSSHWAADCTRNRSSKGPRDGGRRHNQRGKFGRGRGRGARSSNSRGRASTSTSRDYAEGYMACMEGLPAPASPVQPAEN